MTAGPGFDSTPIIVSAGVLAVINPPTLTDRPGGAVPPDFAWVVVVNSTPFTLLVAHGAFLGELAAFTADKYYVELGVGATALTALPQAPVGVLASQDRTVYATWYEADPGGQYPAAIGAGAIAFSPQTVLVPQETVNGPGTTQFGPFSVADAQSIEITFNDVGLGATAWQIQMVWQNSGGILAYTDNTVVGPNGLATYARPTIADEVTVFVSGVGGVGMAGILTVNKLLTPLNGFVTPVNAILGQVTGQSIGAGATTTVLTMNPFAGRATFYASMPSNTTGWQLLIASMDNTGAFTNLGRWRRNNGTDDPVHDTVNLPADPIRVQVNNGDASARNCDVSVVADWYT